MINMDNAVEAAIAFSEKKISPAEFITATEALRTEVWKSQEKRFIRKYKKHIDELEELYHHVSEKQGEEIHNILKRVRKLVEIAAGNLKLS